MTFATPLRWTVTLFLVAAGVATSSPTLARPAHGAAQRARQRFEPTRLTARALWARIEAGERVLVADVRPAEAFDDLHVTGAVSLPWARLPALQAGLPRDRLIVLYCT